MRRRDDHCINGLIRQECIEALKRTGAKTIGEVAHGDYVGSVIPGIGMAGLDAEEIRFSLSCGGMLATPLPKPDRCAT